MARTAPARSALGPFHVHHGHEFEGFRIEEGAGRALLVSLCACGARLDVADAAFAPCPACLRAPVPAGCARCAGTGLVVDHAALEWRHAEAGEEPDASRS